LAIYPTIATSLTLYRPVKILPIFSPRCRRCSKRSKTTGYPSGKNKPTSLVGRMATVKPRERPAIGPLTINEAYAHFKRTLVASKWKVLRGWHILRHRFPTNCAASGIDQRLLDSWLGHTTEIRKRYLHLIPSNEQTAIQVVFGK
jgi:hypothetical protein